VSDKGWHALLSIREGVEGVGVWLCLRVRKETCNEIVWTVRASLSYFCLFFFYLFVVWE